jgi:hypothetical protein
MNGIQLLSESKGVGMTYNGIAHSRANVKTNKLNTNQPTIENDKKDKGLTALKKGQQITGTVISVADQITLDFGGQQVTSSKEVLKDVKPGDVRTFEVVKSNGKEVELRVLNESLRRTDNTFKAVLKNDSSWDTILDQQKKNASKTERENEKNQTKDKLDKINTSITEQDYAELEKEGYKVEDLTVDDLYDALKNVKQRAAGKGSNKDRNNTTDNKDDILSNKLRENNLPVTTDNLTKLSKAMELSALVQGMDDKSMQYLISKQAAPTVENIYKANFIGSTGTVNNNGKLSEAAWKELQGQVTDVITSAGYEVNEKNLTDARWLIENNLPLTEETFTYKKNLDEIKMNSDPSSMLDKMVEGMKEGINPKDVSLIEDGTDKAKQVMTDVQSISDEAISRAVQGDEDLTIKRLKTIQEGIDAQKTSEDTTPETVDNPKEAEATEQANQESEPQTKEYEELKAKRQMEEIRLKMTLEAARQLDKKGIDVETEKLEKVVEELKRLEESYYQKLLKQADVEATSDSVQILKDTTESIDALKRMPCSVLGSTLALRNDQTITGILTEGSKLQADYTKAGIAYETLATVPSSEYGDSIRKAFANADSLLNQMGLDVTEQNQRAVRILGYNQMEITENTINQVKVYDAQVTALMQNLNPAVTVHMIKQGMNPMDMTIRDLNQTIDNIKEEQGITSEDKYSVYLNKLEKQDGISAEERKAYIGIYRLLYNIEKSDGAVLGSVIKADREVTLGNLLTAVQTNKKGSLDAVINDEFGTLESVTKNKESIASQLSSFNSGDGQSNQSMQDDSFVEEQTEYINRILKQITGEVSPGKLKEMEGKRTHSGTTPLLSSDKGVWDSIKEVPVEKLLNQLHQTAETQELDEANYTAKVKELREMCKNAEQSLQFLKDNRLPTTSANIMMANQMLSNGESPIKKVLNLNKERKVENTQNDIMESDELSDKLIDSQTMQQAYEELDTQARSELVQACSGEQIDSQKLAELKSLGQQMTFVKNLANREFYQIPIETEQGITNMNLTILRGAKESGKVTVSVWSEQLGNVKAEFTLKDKVLKGFLGSDNKAGLEHLQKNMSEIENAAQENDITMKKMDYGVLQRENENYSYLSPDSNTEDTQVSVDTERILYRIAKAIVQTVRAAEQNDTAETKAVS